MLRRIFGTPEYLAEIERRGKEQIRREDAAHKQGELKRERNRQVFEEIGKEILKNPEIKSKWQERIKQALEYFEGKDLESALTDYWLEGGDILRNINVIYLFLAMCHDEIISANFIITEDFKKMYPPLFASRISRIYPWYDRETRLPLFWEHIKRDLNTGVDLASKKQNDEKAKSQPEKSSAKAKVLAVLIEHPDWSNTKIAEEAGINRTTLYDYPEFKAARKMQKQNKEKIPRGSKDQVGNVEAVDK